MAALEAGHHDLATADHSGPHVPPAFLRVNLRRSALRASHWLVVSIINRIGQRGRIGNTLAIDQPRAEQDESRPLTALRTRRRLSEAILPDVQRSLAVLAFDRGHRGSGSAKIFWIFVN